MKLIRNKITVIFFLVLGLFTSKILCQQYTSREFHSSLLVDQKIDTTLLMSDRPGKSPFGAVDRSAAVPGWEQLYNTDDFFPHHLGDIWEYIEVDFYTGTILDTFQAIIALDSVDEDGNTHIFFENYYFSHKESYPSGHFLVDTLNHVYHHEIGGLPDFLIYKLYAQQGDQWVMYAYPFSEYEIARLDSVYVQNIFGSLRSVKAFIYFSAPDSTWTTGLARYGSKLAENLGLIYHGGSHDLGYSIYLRGAVINGILYGDTTFLPINSPKIHKSISNEFDLLQNYPNPFNSTTIISFVLKERLKVSLDIFDVTGKRVTRILDNQFLNAGEHYLTWDGKDEIGREVSSGFYFYCLKTKDYSKMKRMLIIR
jgi:hypothetical protein